MTTRKPSLTTVTYPRIDKPNEYLNSLPVRTRMEKAAALVARYEQGRAYATEIRNNAAAQLSASGFSYAEIGQILDVSPSRVKQYVSAEHAKQEARDAARADNNVEDSETGLSFGSPQQYVVLEQTPDGLAERVATYRVREG